MSHFVNFQDQVCLVTGAGSESGIGFCTAKLLGSLGAKVALISTTDRIQKRVQELNSLAITARGYQVDLIDRKQTEDVIKAILSDFGRIDVLVNNAGMTQVGESEDFSEFAEMSYEEWDRSIQRNLTLCFNVTRQVLPFMKAARYGRIVNVSSVTGPVVSNPGEASYSAAKAAIIGMSRAIAIEAAKENIMINNVLPGWIATASQTEGEAAGGLNTPVGRGGSPEEVANMIVFLSSKEASYITGQTFIVDGGNTIQEYKGPKELYY
ncbi:SDR family NAD(P)-dependent oxidoreductase [Sinanaerobacter chloroacetimidivorans]|uniref:SDR family oxidoreductase n=1 Tax=Sinanaerobacter chloroacetimidivorans TaxID=2818044 RepID=A0A8J8B259_9FIRM|nr:SDR family NAD(P)-dependent oxidoreductase [Sinanaerobacter chloroacetimidivorans]MBR0599453.1 SDR family oxidoreductase [Sinanaerobacter chloroacetimidivorans]